MSTIVAPSLLSADFGDLRKDLEMINRSQADMLHLDIMDGVFVPNISFGFPVLKYVAKYCTKPLDLHLMIVEPEKFMDRFQELGVSTYNVHFEACRHLNRTIFEIKNRGMKAAVTLNPWLRIFPDKPYTRKPADVRMGKGKGDVAGYVAPVHPGRILIEVDGGVTFETAPRLVKAGVDVLVSGNTIFSAPDPEKAIMELKKL